ncbi:Maf family protein [Pseudobacteroides cellulosolvens]|uniref:dTTP/UTP pyrophosphatase n=1 Tax=Pseudobacteroides cellulosolvens ATCC 35603 = DSM 2933 TaxID=398512 RepID=A0A0L6JMR7_9FIRM|nr:Maf family protein [Pseudobacteroides cellulosolvens]KNY27091.1 Septum formation protein Maf [Pseudobacteroides cellulosolvens ATCC 35603 = DSM 2933]
MKDIILASASPRRSELLKRIGLKFEVVPADIDEANIRELGPESYTVDIAHKKALDIVNRNYKNSLVIAADTVVVKGGIMGKPTDENEAFEMLKALQGQWHEVITGVAIIDSDSKAEILDYEKTLVKMTSLSDMEIRAYIMSGEPMDKAGSYGIQGVGAMIVERIEGCYFNVVGLPLNKLNAMMRNFGVDLLMGNIQL